MDKSSMLYWYPRIKDLDIPQSKTVIVPLIESEKKAYYEGEGDGLFSGGLTKRVQKAINKFKYPVFIRTDQNSAKHGWEKTCFIKSEESILKDHIFEVTCFTRMADIFGGLPIEAMIVREFIPMDNLFLAFYGNMPVNPEIRLFIDKGKVVCWHWYWVKEAIERGGGDHLPKNWKEILLKTIEEVKTNEIRAIEDMGRIVAEKFNGFWSVDFCRSKVKTWYLIDMAEGKKSWHPKECKHYKSEFD